MQFWRKNMNRNTIKQKTRRSKARLFAMFALMLSATLPSAWAKDNKRAEQDVRVVGKLSFEGNSPSDMVLHETDGKSYLYVRLNGHGGVVVVDVTRPDKLKIVSALPSSSKAPTKRLELEKDVAIVGGGTGDTSHGEYRNDHLTLWDISNPGAPRILQEFLGVKRIIEDARGYVYILDEQGLSAVSDSTKRPDTDQNYNLMGIYG
jgi:hypothetical protein